MFINKQYDSKGKRCEIINNRKCPGKSIFDDKGGCPHWMSMTLSRSDGIEEDNTGCGIMMMPMLLFGITKNVGGVCASVQSNRNEMVEGLNNIKNTFNQGFGGLIQIAQENGQRRLEESKSSEDL